MFQFIGACVVYGLAGIGLTVIIKKRIEEKRKMHEAEARE